jgi:hypothetical protein
MPIFRQRAASSVGGGMLGGIGRQARWVATMRWVGGKPPVMEILVWPATRWVGGGGYRAGVVNFT